MAVPIVYVAGPLGRDLQHPYRRRSPWTKLLLGMIRREAGQVGVRLLLPESDEIDPAEPAAFYSEIDRRISGADAVISILGDGDRESAVEAVLAATHGKRQLIVARQPHQVPRLLRGMPGVIEVAVSVHSQEIVLPRFLRRVRDQDWNS